MAFNSSLLGFLLVLLSSLFFIASSSSSTSSEAACNFNDVFTFGVGKTSVSSDGIVLPHPNAASHQIKDTDFGAPDSYIMNEDFFARNGMRPLEGSSSLDSQISQFLDFLAGSSLEDRKEELRNTLIMINQPGLMDYRHALQVKSVVQVIDLVEEVVAEIKNAIRRLIHGGVSNIVVSGLRPRALSGLEILTNLHRADLYFAIADLRVEFPEVHISQLDYTRMDPKGKDYLFENIEVSEACKSFLEREGHLM